MMSWIFIVPITVGLGVFLWRFCKLSQRAALPMCAALTLALAGYAWQGQPLLQDAPGEKSSERLAGIDELLLLRKKMERNFTASTAWLTLSDSYSRKGDFATATQFINIGLLKNPKDGDLWAALGLQLMLANGGSIGEPAKLAFEKAKTHRPEGVAVAYFEGLNLVLKGEFLEAQVKWKSIMGLANDDEMWKPTVDAQLNKLDQLIALQNAEKRATENAKK